MDETESEARKEKLAEEAEERIRRGAHWTDWMYIADGLAVGRVKAMRSAGTNQPYGKAYTRAFGSWMTERPWARNLDKATRAHLFWAVDHRSEIETWRETLAQNERVKLNHPTTLKRRYDAAHQTSDKDPNKPKKETAHEATKRENEELWAKNKELERRLQNDGSLFDLRHDPIESIVGVIAGTVSIGRFESLQRAMTKKLTALKAAEKTKTARAG